ncbi:unnamed protein product [Amoebophrya sp. A25]|nr:unnamed protein product [Amoebophrya sp. A25]|eukprot:GSA25T00000481001.1
MATELKKLTALLLESDLGPDAATVIRDARPRVEALRARAVEANSIYGPVTREKIRHLVESWNQLREAYNVTDTSAGPLEVCAWGAVAGTTSTVPFASAAAAPTPSSSSSSSGIRVGSGGTPKRQKVDMPHELLPGGGTRAVSIPVPMSASAGVAAGASSSSSFSPSARSGVDAMGRTIAAMGSTGGGSSGHLLPGSSRESAGASADTPSDAEVTSSVPAAPSSSSTNNLLPTSSSSHNPPNPSNKRSTAVSISSAVSNYPARDSSASGSNPRASSTSGVSAGAPPDTPDGSAAPLTSATQVFDRVHRYVLQTGLLTGAPDCLETSASLTRIRYQRRGATIELMFITTGPTALILRDGVELMKVQIPDSGMQEDTIKKKAFDCVIYPLIYGLAQPTFDNLPAEVLDYVLSFLDIKSLGRTERASKLVYTQTTTAPYMRNFVWQNVFQRIDAYGRQQPDFVNIDAAQSAARRRLQLPTGAHASRPSTTSSYAAADEQITSSTARAGDTSGSVRLTTMTADDEYLVERNNATTSTGAGGGDDAPPVPRVWKEACRYTSQTLAGIRQTAEREREAQQRERDIETEVQRRMGEDGRHMPPPFAPFGGGRGMPQVPRPGIWYDPVNPFDPRGINLPEPGRGPVPGRPPGVPHPDFPEWNPDLPNPGLPRPNPLRIDRPPRNPGMFPFDPDAERDLHGINPAIGGIPGRPEGGGGILGDPRFGDPNQQFFPGAGGGLPGGAPGRRGGPRFDPTDPFGGLGGKKGGGKGRGGFGGGVGGGGFGGFSFS